MLTEVEMREAEARLFMTTVYILITNDWDAAKATPGLIAEVHGDKGMLTALLHAFANDPLTAPYHDELLSMKLVRNYASYVATKWDNRVERAEVGNG